ncbi:MAG: hypothetical protein IJP33_00915 [Firmicutes bacterium]|nr:hypothetical protein [Bacillota bacterium]
MEALVFGFLYLAAFMAGAILSYLMLSRLAAEEAPQVQMDMPPQEDDKLKKQYDNMFRYNGTERGQMSLE